MSQARCASTSVASSSTRSCLAASGSPKLPATECRSPDTIHDQRERTRTIASRWRWSSVAKNRGLGRGLAALVAEFPAGQVSLVELDIEQVRPNPRQPRKRFDDDAINALAESIKSEGVVQPIIVRDAGDGYQIVAGERRWRASRRAGLSTIPAIVRPLDERESMIMALAENVAREDLNPVEQARAYAVLADELDLSQTEIARRVGKSRPAVANTMRLLELPDDVLDLVPGGGLPEAHGRALPLASGH